MTITYSHKVSKVRFYGFTRLLFYWKGSIYKLLYKEMAIFVVSYTALTLVYRLVLNSHQKRLFEKIVIHFDAFTNLIPMSFILGFYVSIVLTRWWQQYTNIPWPDRCATYISTMIHGTDEMTRILRRSMIRYLNLASVLMFQSISTCVKKRFPTMNHLVLSGLMTEKERLSFDLVESQHPKFWIPCMWCSTLASRAREEGKIRDDINLKAIMDEISAYRGCLGMLFSYDWISIPLVYTQVTTLAVYSYFFACLMGRQFLDPERRYQGHELDLYVPMFTVLQFFFYVGWIKVAEQLINPFGEDDDDFEINWIIDRNVQVGLLMVDQMYMITPPLEKDPFWDIAEPDIPYTKSTLYTKVDPPFMGSTADLSMTKDDMRVVIHNGQGLEPIIEGKPFKKVEEIPTSSPVKRKLYLDVNVGTNSPRIMSTDSLFDCARQPETKSHELHACSPDVQRPLLTNEDKIGNTLQPLQGREWIVQQQEKYLQSLQKEETLDVFPPNVQSCEGEPKLSTGERFLQHWLQGDPSVCYESGPSEKESVEGREKQGELLVPTKICKCKNEQVQIQNDGTAPTQSVAAHNEVADGAFCSGTKLTAETCNFEPTICDQVNTDLRAGKAKVESWLQDNQFAKTATEKTGKFEQSPVVGPYPPVRSKLRGPLQVSFSESCEEVPQVEYHTQSVVIDLPENLCDESGCTIDETHGSGGSYCTQSTVNSMKALLSST